MNAFPIILLLIITVPLVELYVLIKIGSVIGALPTLGLIILTALVGAALLRQQGLVTLHRFRIALDEGSLPAMEIVEGVALLIGGVLLLTPGFVTDAVGFLFLLPTTRKAMLKAAVKRSRYTQNPPVKGRVIEGEIVDKRDDSS
jgi:UPF0716 protein FxsA